MEQPPLVSVIIPAYNAGKYIRETIESVIRQSYTALEIIVINDGSSDNTEDIVNSFSSEHRIKYIAQKNRGCSGAKNTGLHASTGEFIQYLDADDLLSHNKIEEQVAILKGKPDAMAVCKTTYFYEKADDPENRELDTEFLHTTTNTLDFLLNLYGLNGKNGMIQPNAFLISKQIAEKTGPWNESISPAPDEDGEYFCRAMLAANEIYFTVSGMNFYRKKMGSGSSLSGQVSHVHAQGALKSLQLITKHLLQKENAQRVKVVMARHFANFMYQYSQFSDLRLQAFGEIQQLGIEKIPSVGGNNFKKMRAILGFKNALFLKNYLGAGR